MSEDAKSAEAVLPDTFTLTVARHKRMLGAWVITSDAHKRFFNVVPSGMPLAVALAECPAILADMIKHND